MDRAAVANLPRWERDILQRWGVAMLSSAPTVHSTPGAYADTPPAQREFTREDVLTMTASEMGLV